MNQKYEEFKKELKTKKIAVIGVGVSNLPLIKVLKELDCDITVFDKKTIEQMSDEVA